MVITHQKNFLIAPNCIISFLPVCQIFCWTRYAFNKNWPLSCHCRTYLTVKERIRKQICSCAQALLRVAMRGAICWFGGTRAQLTSELQGSSSYKAGVCTGRTTGKFCYSEICECIFICCVSIYWWSVSTYSCYVWIVGKKVKHLLVYLPIHAGFVISYWFLWVGHSFLFKSLNATWHTPLRNIMSDYQGAVLASEMIFRCIRLGCYCVTDIAWEKKEKVKMG